MISKMLYKISFFPTYLPDVFFEGPIFLTDHYLMILLPIIKLLNFEHAGAIW